jgi:hypothetical protein
MSDLDTRLMGLKTNDAVAEAGGRPGLWKANGNLLSWGTAGILNTFGVNGADPAGRKKWDENLRLGESIARSYDDWLQAGTMDPEATLAHVLTQGGDIRDASSIQQRLDALSIIYPEIKQSVRVDHAGDMMGNVGQRVEAKGGFGAPAQPTDESPDPAQPQGQQIGANLQVRPMPKGPEYWLAKLGSTVAPAKQTAAEQGIQAHEEGREPDTSFSAQAVGVEAPGGMRGLTGTAALQREQEQERGIQGQKDIQAQSDIAQAERQAAVNEANIEASRLTAAGHVLAQGERSAGLMARTEALIKSKEKIAGVALGDAPADIQQQMLFWVDTLSKYGKDDPAGDIARQAFENSPPGKWLTSQKGVDTKAWYENLMFWRSGAEGAAPSPNLPLPPANPPGAQGPGMPPLPPPAAPVMPTGRQLSPDQIEAMRTLGIPIPGEVKEP